MAKAKRNKAPKKRPKWTETETGIEKRWTTPDGTPARLWLGRTLDNKPVEQPPKPPRRRSRRKRDNSDIPF